MHLPNLGMAMVPPLRLALLMAAATMAACVPVGTPPESLWRQLAALPVLTSHAMQGRNAELLSDLAESAAESAERELVQKAADRVVTALCSNRTRTIASRLEHALVQVVPDELVITQPSAPGAAPTAGDASVPAVSNLQLGESPFDTDGAGGMGTMVLLERAWQLLPETLLQTINTQAHIPPPPPWGRVTAPPLSLYSLLHPTRRSSRVGAGARRAPRAEHHRARPRRGDLRRRR